MLELYRSETMLVRCIAAPDTTRWVVTFDNYGSGASFDRNSFGQEFLAQSGISQINILGSGNHWYQYPDIGIALAQVRAHVADAARVVTYGSSMGGYAAIRFAEQVGADCCLALSPQYSNDPAKVPFEWRWSNDASAIIWLPEVDGPIRPGVRTIVMADTRREDAEHVRRIAAEIPIEYVGLAYVAHPIGTFLSEAGLLQRAVVQLVQDTFDIAAFRREAEAGRRQSPVHLGELARVQPSWRPRTGVALARRALDRVPHSPLAHHILAKRLEDAGRHDEALVMHARAVELGDGFSGYAMPYSQALVRAGHLGQGHAIAARLVREEPESAALQSWLGQVCWLMGQSEDALRHARIARRLAPGNPHYRATLASYHLPRRIADWCSSAFERMRRIRRHGPRR